MRLPNPTKQVYTIGVKVFCDENEAYGDIWAKVITEYKKQPNQCHDGGNDKFFFSFTFKDTKFFSVANEQGGLTIMLPNEY